MALICALLVAACADTRESERAELTQPRAEVIDAAPLGRAKALAITPQQAALAQWTAPLPLSIVPAAAAVLGNGKVLLWAAERRTNYGGSGNTYTTLFDPATLTANERNVTETGHDMFCPGTAMLADGRLLVNGGLDSGRTSIYDPISDSWTAAGLMFQPRGYNASTTLADGSVLTVGGSWSGGVGAKVSELFTVAGGWRPLLGISTATTTLNTGDVEGYFRADNHMWLLPTGNGQVLHAGPSKNMHWLDVSGEGSLAAAGTRADDDDSMSGNAVMFDADKVLTLGGSVNYIGSASSTSAFVIDTRGGLAQTRRVGAMAYPRIYANSVVLPNGQVVVVGGQTFGAPFSDSNSVLPTELFDPETETFTLLPPLTVPRNYHSVALLLPDGRVMSAGGGLCDCAADHPDLQLLSPPYLFNANGSPATRPTLTSVPISAGYGSTLSVNTDGPVTAFSLVRLGAATHTVNNDQRRVALAFSAAGNNRYALALPSNPGVLVPGQWMLFAMNAQGTPSVAKIITISGAGAPVLRNPGNLALALGASVQLPLVASTPSGTLSFSALGLPAGVVINANTGTLSGVANQAGDFLITLRVSNGSHTVSTDLRLSVVAPGTGSGLLAQYFNNITVSGAPALQRTEAPNFDWVNAAPGPGVVADLFSVRWSGWLEAAATGTTRLQTLSDDGVRVWVDGRLVIDNWTAHGLTPNGTSLNLRAGQRVAVMVEHYDAGGVAALRLMWQPPASSTFVAVPLARLYPAATPATDNLAQGRAASQSSTYDNASAARAVDGNTGGAFASGSVTHTAGTAARDWWQVDLGRLADIDRIQLWNRSDCCAQRLANFTVFVSASDISGRSFEQLNNDASVIKRELGVSTITPQISLPVAAQGRWVRVQLRGSSALHLAEVQVFGREAVIYRTPTLNPVAAQQTTAGSPASLNLVATEPDGRALSYGASGLPPGVSLNTGSGVISGTPSTVGVYAVTVTAKNAGNLQASQSFNWTVRAAGLPTLSSLPAPLAKSGISVAYSPVLSGGAGTQYSWDFGDGSAATTPGSSAGTTHVFAAAGVYTVTLTQRAADGTVGVYRFVQAVASNAPVASAWSSTDLLVEPRLVGAARVWVVNPDNDSVTVLDAGSLQRLAEVPVGAAPRTLARAPDGRIWVVNKAAASISVIHPDTLTVVQTLPLPRASQPHGIVIAPADGAAFVTLEASGRLLKLAATGAVLADQAVGNHPRHLALSADGSRLLLSRFITPALPGESTAAVRTLDDAGAAVGGEVLRLSATTLAVSGTTVLAHSERSDGDSQGRGFPNYLGAPAIAPDGSSAWVPSKQDNLRRGSLRDGQLLNFQSTVRAVSSRINLATGTEDPAQRIDHDNASLASAALFHPAGVYLLVALETSRQVAVVDAVGRRELFRLEVGLAPQGMALSVDGSRLFVHNVLSRSISVLDLRPLLQAGQFSATPVATPATVVNEKLAPAVLRGKQLFHDARDPRLARDSYMSCASCHNDGGHDGRVWDFTQAGEGLRNTISLRGRGGAAGRLHWSGNFDEVQDFEGQIRALAGGTGLMDNNLFNTGTRAQPLGDAKAGLSADLDALAAYLNSLNSFSLSPQRSANGDLSADALAGRAVFAARCASCHSGADYSDSGKKVLHHIGTQKAASGGRLGGPLAGLDVPTLRDVWATAPYLHDGSAATLEAAVLAHGLGLSAADLAAVVSFTRQIGSEEAAAVAGPANLVVRAFSTLLDKVGALFEVRVAGQVVGRGQLDATTAVDLLYNVATLAKDTLIDVVFKNNADSATEDRNMVVQSVRVNGSAVVNATAAGVMLDQGSDGAAFDGIDTLPSANTGGWMPWNSAMRFLAPATAAADSVVVRVVSTLAAGVGANVELRLNGTLMGSRQVNTTAVQDLVFNTPAVQVGDRLDVVFTNDAVIGTEDRNLRVLAVVARGQTLSPVDTGVLIDRGSGPQAFDGVNTLAASSTGGWLFWNAALRLLAK